MKFAKDKNANVLRFNQITLRSMDLNTLKSMVAGFAATAIFAITSACAFAQDGPPDNVRQSIDAVVKLMGTSGDKPLRDFVMDNMVGVDSSEMNGVINNLRNIRAAAKDLRDDMTVEAEDNGVQIILSGHGKSEQISVSLNEQGITNISMGEVRQGLNGGNRDSTVRGHIQALEGTAFKSIKEISSEFEKNHFAPSYKSTIAQADRLVLLEKISIAAKQAGGAFVDEKNGGIVLTLEGPATYAVAFTVESGSPYRITSLELSEMVQTASSLEFTKDNLAKKLDELEAEGLSGIVYLKLDGKIVHHKAYGAANKKTGRPITLDTIFGVGSRPIDFTIASIYLLAQQGKLNLDDPLTKYFSIVPQDKRKMTIRHLLTGQSGLPDFHGLPSDWDQDLAWIDRDTAMDRIFAQPLLFKPGVNNAHSHSAFGVLAAIVELRSSQTYYNYIRQNFLDPAGMTRTGENGENRGFTVNDFAVGGGNSFVGVPNIPPNWGPTSWLVMGSGGMYSTVGDLIKFYDYVRSGNVLDSKFAAHFNGRSVQVDGSERGFNLFSSYSSKGSDDMYFMTNMKMPGSAFEEVGEALNAIVENDWE